MNFRKDLLEIVKKILQFSVFVRKLTVKLSPNPYSSRGLVKPHGENTTMKKTITIITLALLMVVSIFADTTKTTFTNAELKAGTATVNTTVELTLEKEPKYIIGITSGALSGVNPTDPSTTVIANQDTIQLTRNALTFNNVSDYYLSFVLYEYEAVDVTLTLNGNMKHSGYDSADTAAKANYEIPYTLTVAAGSDKNQDNGSLKTFTETKLESNNSAKCVWKAEYTAATTKLGEYNWATLKLTIASTSDTALNGKVAGRFSNTITVKVASHS